MTTKQVKTISVVTGRRRDVSEMFMAERSTSSKKDQRSAASYQEKKERLPAISRRKISRQPAAIFMGMEALDRLIWLVRPYRSISGNSLEIPYTFRVS
jgi:hypothetical protein